MLNTVEITNKVFTFSNLNEIEACIERAAEKIAERDIMFLNIIPAKNKPFGYYWVEGTDVYYLVRFWKIGKTGAATCACKSTVECYHIGGSVQYHMLQAKKYSVNGQMTSVKVVESTRKYEAPRTDANSEVGLKAKERANQIMQEVKGDDKFTFTAKEFGACMWCDNNEHQELDGFHCCKSCCKRAYDARMNLEIKPTNHAYDKYKTVSGKIKLGTAVKAYANGGMLD